MFGEIGTDVVQTVDTAELFDGAVDETLHRLRIGQIEFNGNGTPAGPRDLFGGAGGAGGVDVADDHASTFSGKAFGGTCADPGGAARDQEGLVLQAAHQT